MYTLPTTANYSEHVVVKPNVNDNKTAMCSDVADVHKVMSC